MTDIKLVAVDLDGTLLNSSKRYPEDFPLWVTSHPNICTVIASGRQYYKLREQFASIAGKLYYVAENGGVVYNPAGELLYSDCMSKASAKEAIAISSALPYAQSVVCGIKAAYIKNDEGAQELARECKKYYASIQIVDSFDSVEDDILKIAVFIPNKAAEVYSTISNPSEIAPEVTAVLSGADWIDMGKTECCKGQGIAVLQKLLNIAPSASVAFGDYINDLSMFECCDISFAMANALSEVKAAAHFVTNKSNEDGGVMDALRSIIEE